MTNKSTQASDRFNLYYNAYLDLDRVRNACIIGIILYYIIINCER